MGWAPVGLAGVAAFAEAMVGLGLVLPGELTISGLSASVDSSEIAWMVLAAVVGACAGDQVNYWVGRRIGPRLRTTRLIQRVGTGHWDRGVDLVGRHGSRAVLGSQLIPVVRTLVPVAAGAGRLSLFRFTAASIAGSVAWATLWVCAGAAGAQLARASPSLVVLGLLTLGVGWLWLKRRAGRKDLRPAASAPGPRRRLAREDFVP